MYSSNWFARVAVAGLFMAALIALPATSYAQIGTLAGKVVDAEGKPVAGATVVFDNPENGLHFEAKTNNKGEWTRPGLMLTGKWVITVEKDGMSAKVPDIPIRMNSVTETPTVTLAPSKKPTMGIAGMDPAKKAETDKLAGEIQTALDAKDYDTAITKLNAVAALIDKCSICYTQIGDAYMKKTNFIDAETAYLKSIEFDATSSPDAYDALANIYNQQRKYDDAAKMAEKAMSIKAAKTGGMALDAEGEYNAAVIAFNASKIPEARTHLERVLQMKPEHAEAHYLFGMVLINQGKIPDAKKELQKYVELSPTGANVDMAKAIIAAQ